MRKAVFMLFVILAAIPMPSAGGEEALPIGSRIHWSGTSANLQDDVFLASYGYTYPPFDANASPARIVRTTVPQTLVRFYTPGFSGPLGSWATAASEVRGLTPDQVWDRLALPQSVPPGNVVMMLTPTKDIAPGTDETGAWLIGGSVAPITYKEGSFSRHLNGGAYQYFLLGPNKPAGMVETLTGAGYGVPAVVFQSGNYTTGLILNADGSSNQGRALNGTIPVFSYLYSSLTANGSNNVRTIAAALDALNAPATSPLYEALYQPLDIYWIRGQDADIVEAIARINPEGYGAVAVSRLHKTAGILDALASRWDEDAAGPEGLWHVWGSIGGNARRMGNWSSDEGGITFGADRKWSEHWRAGVFMNAGLLQTAWRASGSAKAKDLSFGMYTRHESASAWHIDLAAMGGTGWVQSRRRAALLDEPLVAGATPFGALAFLPDPKIPQAEFSPWDAALHIALGREMRRSRWLLHPRLQMDGLFSRVPAFTEAGAGALNWSYDDLGGQAVRIRGDVTVSLSPNSENGLKPWLRVGLTRYEECGNPSFTVRFAEGNPVRLRRSGMDTTSGAGAAGLGRSIGKWFVSGRVEGEWGGVNSYGARITIRRTI